MVVVPDDNRSTTVRKAVFFGYTYRWVRARDEPPADASGFTPVQRQLWGLLEHDGNGDHAWAMTPQPSRCINYCAAPDASTPTSPHYAPDRAVPRADRLLTSGGGLLAVQHTRDMRQAPPS